MNNKERYKQFCESEVEIPIFSQYWWLDIVCDRGYWDVSLFEKGGQIVGSMPYYVKKRLFFDVITMPRLTHTMGPYIKYPKKQKYFKQLSFEKDVYNGLIAKLPSFDFYKQNFSTKVCNILPFHWKGYINTTVYTYIVECSSIDGLDDLLEPDIKRRRKNAVKKGVQVKESTDVDSFYRLNQETYKRQNTTIPYSLELVRKLYFSCLERSSVKLLTAEYDGKTIAAGFFVYDKQSVYYLMGGVDTDYKNMGGMDLVLYEAIVFAVKSNRKFDFEGSMVESIEKYFRGFGTKQVPMFQVQKTNSMILKLRELVKN